MSAVSTITTHFQLAKGYVRYINILTQSRGFRVKFVIVLIFFCLSIPKSKKTTLNIEVCPETVSEPCQNIDISSVAYLSLQPERRGNLGPKQLIPQSFVGLCQFVKLFIRTFAIQDQMAAQNPFHLQYSSSAIS